MVNNTIFCLQLARLYSAENKFELAYKYYREFFKLSKRFPEEKTYPESVIPEYKTLLQANGKPTEGDEYIEEFNRPVKKKTEPTF